MLGLATMITQVIVLRKMLTLFSGNELIIGIILSAWMVLTSFGAWLGRRQAGQSRSLQFLLPLLAALTVVMVPTVYEWLFNPGVETGPFAAASFVFAVLAPFCLLSGYLFPGLTEILEGKGNLTARSYATESVGSIAGSMLVTLALYFLKDDLPLESFMVALYFLLLVLFFHQRKINNRVFFLLAVVLGISISIFIAGGSGIMKNPGLFQSQKILARVELPSGEVTITEYDEQISVFFNRKPLFSTGNKLIAEESVHIPLSMHPGPGKILCITDGTPEIPREILKYEPEVVDMVATIRGLKEVISSYIEYPSGEEITFFEEDARSLLKKRGEHYDVILVDAPAPSSAATNRYYSVDFFRMLAENLSHDGIISLRMASSPQYLGDYALRMNSIVYATLRDAFPYVQPVVSNGIYYIASRRALELNITETLTARGIPTDHVNPWYFDESSVIFRSSLLKQELNPQAPVNTDFHPMAYSGYLTYWLERHQSGTVGIVVVLSLLFLYFFIHMKAPLSGIFMAGFTGGSMQLLLLLAFQILYGTLYLQLGAIMAAFMAGLALGALYGYRLMPVPSLRSYSRLHLLFSLLPLLVAWLVPRLGAAGTGSSMIAVLLFIMMAVAGLFTGSLFSSGTLIYRAGNRLIASGSYMADLAGSAIGTLGVAVVLLPVAGFSVTALLLAAGQILAAGRLWISVKK